MASMSRSHADIVRAAGTDEEVAQRCEVTIYAVRSWRARNRIPADKWAVFAATGKTTLEELAMALAARNAA